MVGVKPLNRNGEIHTNSMEYDIVAYLTKVGADLRDRGKFNELI